MSQGIQTSVPSRRCSRCELWTEAEDITVIVETYTVEIVGKHAEEMTGTQSIQILCPECFQVYKNSQHKKER